MVGKKNPDVERCLQMALKGVDAEAAWKRCGCPGTLANLKRHIKAAAPSTAGGAAEPSAPSAGKRRRSMPAETPHQRQQSTSAASASAATRKRKEQPHGEVLSGRTGAPLGKKIRKTSLQLETEVQNKALFYQEYKAAHKARLRASTPPTSPRACIGARAARRLTSLPSITARSRRTASTISPTARSPTG